MVGHTNHESRYLKAIKTLALITKYNLLMTMDPLSCVLVMLQYENEIHDNNK